MIYNIEQSRGKEGRDDSEEYTLDHKGKTYKSVGRADRLHNADFKLSAEHCDSDCVRNDDKRDDEQQSDYP